VIDRPEHIVDSYREPADCESFDSYKEGDNCWKMLGFGRGLSACESVHDLDMRRYRSLLMHYCATNPTLYSLLRITWPHWIPKC
jgi:hypothetical protein